MKGSIKNISKKIVKEVKDHKDELMWFGVGIVLSNIANGAKELNNTVFIFAEVKNEEDK